jgi:pantetheine-phosphate adenylyltransferase
MRRAVYPGTFDPITNGHLDIIRRAQRLFDELVIAIAANPQKAPLLDFATRETLVRRSVESMPGVRVVAFDGLLVQLVKDQEADVILRGLRAVSDFEFEFQMALMNRELSAGAETIYLMPSVEYIFISSTIIKNIAAHGGPVRNFVPAHVEEALRGLAARKSQA